MHNVSCPDIENYAVTIFKHGINTDRNAMNCAIEEKTFTANDKLQLHLAPAGGFLVKLKGITTVRREQAILLFELLRIHAPYIPVVLSVKK